MSSTYEKINAHKHRHKANEANRSSSSSIIIDAIRSATMSHNDNHENNPSKLALFMSTDNLVNYISHFRFETLQSSLNKNKFHRTDDRKLVKQVRDEIDQIKKHESNVLNFDSMFTHQKKHNLCS